MLFECVITVVIALLVWLLLRPRPKAKRVPLTYDPNAPIHRRAEAFFNAT